MFTQLYAVRRSVGSLEAKWKRISSPKTNSTLFSSQSANAIHHTRQQLGRNKIPESQRTRERREKEDE